MSIGKWLDLAVYLSSPGVAVFFIRSFEHFMAQRRMSAEAEAHLSQAVHEELAAVRLDLGLMQKSDSDCRKNLSAAVTQLALARVKIRELQILCHRTREEIEQDMFDLNTGTPPGAGYDESIELPPTKLP